METNKIFGLDIDGTVTSPAAFIPYLNEQFNKSITLEDITQYELAPLLNITEDQFWKWMEKNEKKIYANVDLSNHFNDFLNNYKNNHTFIYISARGEHLLETTESWFAKNNIPFHHIELTGKHDKIEAVKKHNIDIFFEDKHDNACNIAEECDIPVILLDTPYNQKPIPQNVVRVKNWLEANEWLNTWLK